MSGDSVRKPPTLWCPVCATHGRCEALVWSRVVGPRLFLQSHEQTGDRLNTDPAIEEPYWLGRCGSDKCAAEGWVDESFAPTRWYEVMTDSDSRKLKLLIIRTSREARKLRGQGGAA